MKRLLILALAVLLVVSMAACGGASPVMGTWYEESGYGIVEFKGGGKCTMEAMGMSFDGTYTLNEENGEGVITIEFLGEKADTLFTFDGEELVMDNMRYTKNKVAQKDIGDAFDEAMDEAFDEMDDAMEDMGAEPNDDGFDDDYQNETAGVDDGDGNGEEITVDTVDSEVTVNGGEWPADAPEGVPQLGAGTITGVATTPMGAVVTYTGVDRETADNYAAGLEAAGWQRISESVDSDWMNIFFQKDMLFLDIEWELGDCYITWSNG